MSRDNPPLSPMSDELREHLDGLVQTYIAARIKEDHLKKRMNAMTGDGGAKVEHLAGRRKR